MTLALYGKSRRRQLLLILLALVSVGIAVFGGSSRVFRAFEADAAPVQIFADSFGTYPGVWTDGGDGVDVSASQDGHSAVLDINDDQNNFAHAAVNTTGYNTIVVAFECRADTDNDSNDDLLVRYSTNGGSTWTTAATFDTHQSSGDGCQDDGWQARTVDLSAVSAVNNNANFRIRFEGSGLGDSSEHVYVDNVVVTGESAGPQPDLTVTKTAEVSGNPVTSVAEDSTFNWVWRISNTTATASFANGDVILRDRLPDLNSTTTPAYGSPTIVTTPGNVSCAVSSPDSGSNDRSIICTATGAVNLAAGSNVFVVSLPVTPANDGTLDNTSQTCVDPDNEVAESDNGNNTCSSSVTVEAPDIYAWSVLNPGGFSQCVAPDIQLIVDNSTSIGSSALATMKTNIGTMINSVEGALPGANWRAVAFRDPTSAPPAITSNAGGWQGDPTTNVIPFINGMVSDGYTPTAHGIQQGIANGTNDAAKPNLMIIITDGDPNVVYPGGDAGSPDFEGGTVSAIAAADAARAAGWNTAVVVFGPGDSNSTVDSVQVMAALAGDDIAGPAGDNYNVGNVSNLGQAIIDSLLQNCAGTVNIVKRVDGVETAGWTFNVTKTGGDGTIDDTPPFTTQNPGGLVTVDFAFPEQNDTVTVNVQEVLLSNAFDFQTASCVGGIANGTLDAGTRTISGIQLGPNSTVTCTFDNVTSSILTQCPQGDFLAKYNFSGGTYVFESGSDVVSFANIQADGDADWTTSAPNYVSLVIVKAGTEYKNFSYPAGTLSGSFDNDGLLTNGDQNPNISHVEFCQGDPPPNGNLTINKFVWGGESWVATDSELFDFLADGATDYNYDGAGTQVVAPGSYTVTETSLADSFYLVKIGTCEAPAGPGTLGTQSASATVVAGQTATVCAYNARIQRATVDKTGSGRYNVDWSVDKTVDPATVNLPDDGSGTTDYTVTVNKTYSSKVASGTIQITNPNPVAISVTVSDPAVTLTGACATNPVNVPANDSVSCGWSTTFAGDGAPPTDYTNTVQVTTANGVGSNSDTTDPIVFTIGTGTESVTVTDNFGGSHTGDFPDGDVISTSTTFEYTGTHTCAGITGYSSTTGIGTKTVNNTASITDTVGTNNSDSASVQVNCQRPKLTVTKVVDGGDADPEDWTMGITGSGGATGSFSAYVPSSSAQTVTESTGPAGYTLTSVVCEDENGQPVSVSGSGLSRSLTMPASVAGDVLDVTCTFTNTAQAPLEITKAGSGTYVKDNDWTIIKSVVGDDNVTVPDNGDHKFNFDIDVTKTVTYDNVQASGTITITNPASNASPALINGLSDSTAGTAITICRLNGTGGALSFNPAYELAPGDFIECLWSTSALQDLASPPSSFVNTATVTVDDESAVAGGDSNDATINFSLSGTTGPETVDVSDIFDGDDQGVIANDVSTTTNNIAFSATVACADLEGEYNSEGLLTGTRDNFARLSGTDFTLDSNTVTVTLNCQRPQLTLEKVVAGDTPPGGAPADTAWTLTANADGSANDLSGAEGTPGASRFVPTGTDYTFGESAGDNRYALTSVICRNDAGQVLYNSPDGLASFDMPNEDVTCTFTNTYVPTTLKVDKIINRVLPGLADDGQFRVEGFPLFFTPVIDAVATNGQVDGTSGVIAVRPGAYTVRETLQSGGGGSIDNYTRTITCTLDGEVMPNVNNIPLPAEGVGLTLALSDDVVCTVTNTRKSATVTVTKVTQDAAGVTITPDVDFPFTSGQVPGFNLNTSNNPSDDFVRPVGSTFGVAEVLGALDTDWNLVSATCSGATDTDGVTTDADVTITVPDGPVTCSFINKQEAAKLTIVKDAQPNDDDDFHFEVHLGGGGEPLYEFDLDDDGDNTLPNTWVSPDPLVPGSYHIDEVVDVLSTAWALQHPVVCVDNNTGDPLTDPQQTNTISDVVLDIQPGDDITCTFVNEGFATLNICKAIFYDGAFVDGSALPGLAGPTTFTANMDGAAAPDLSATTPLTLTAIDGYSYNGVPVQADCDTATVPAGVNYTYGAEDVSLPSSAWMTPLYLDQAGGTACAYNAGAACDGQVNNVQPGETRTVVVINEWKLASLEVTKTVDWGDVTPDAGQTFNICIQGPSYPDGDEAGACQVADSDGAVLTWNDLIPGNYTVSEQPLADANLWSVSGSGVSVDAPQGGQGTHTITNTRLSGALTVTKTVDENGGEAGDWSFEICIVGPSYPDTSDDGVTLPDDTTDGCQLVNEADPLAEWPVLDQGAYTVVERFPNGDQDDWDVTINSVVAVIADGVASNDTTVSVVDGETAQGTVLNTLKKGQLIIEKRYGTDWETATCEDPAEADIPVMLLDGNELEDGDGCTWPSEGSYPVDPNEDHTITEQQREGWALIDVQLEGQCGQALELDVAEIIVSNLVLGIFGQERDYSSLIPVTVNVPAGESCSVSFLNEPVGDIVIVKYENVPTAGAQDWNFAFNRDGSPVGSSLLNTGANPAGNPVASTVTTIPDVPVGSYDVAELEGQGQCDINSLTSDYQTHALVSSDELPEPGDLTAPASFVGDSAVGFTVTKGETTYIAFSNRGCGTVLSGANLFVRKFESPDGAFAGTEPLEGWTMTITGTGGIATGFQASLPTNNEGVAAFGAVPAGTYTVCEATQPTHEVVGSLLNDADPVAGVCRTGVQVITPEGEEEEINVVVDFFNRSHGQLIVRKVVDHGSNTHVFTADVLFEAQDVPFSVVSPSDPISLPSGAHLVSEDADPDYRYDGWAIAENGVCPAEPTNTGQVASVDIAVGEDTVLCFYNTGLGAIRVEKSTFLDGQPIDERDGWTITVAGCGFFEVVETGEDGVAFVDDIPACADVTVQEDPESHAGYTPVSGTVRVVTVEAFQTTVVSFRNDRFTEREETPTPEPSNTPTTTPTNTPTNTPTGTTGPTDTPTSTPTPVDTVAGEITPGAKATPIAPDTGVGFLGAGSGSPLMLLVLAILSISAGLALLGIGRRANRDR